MTGQGLEKRETAIDALEKMKAGYWKNRRSILIISLVGVYPGHLIDSIFDPKYSLLTTAFAACFVVTFWAILLAPAYRYLRRLPNPIQENELQTDETVIDAVTCHETYFDGIMINTRNTLTNQRIIIQSLVPASLDSLRDSPEKNVPGMVRSDRVHSILLSDIMDISKPESGLYYNQIKLQLNPDSEACNKVRRSVLGNIFPNRSGYAINIDSGNTDSFYQRLQTAVIESQSTKRRK
ncbi:hypothetical protein HY994_05640 [Candidatus Micrarchaeota archaeon]|nr:hypothetical protein [Candidatus Micrarchaeota archaeon]